MAHCVDCITDKESRCKWNSWHVVHYAFNTCNCLHLFSSHVLKFCIKYSTIFTAYNFMKKKSDTTCKDTVKGSLILTQFCYHCLCQLLTHVRRRAFVENKCNKMSFSKHKISTLETELREFLYLRIVCVSSLDDYRCL